MNSPPTDDATPVRTGFWQRQFSPVSTPHQVAFDVMFGILMPLLCFYFDPGILRESTGLNLPRLPHALFIYGMSAVAISTLIIWLFCAPWMKSAAAIVAGVFAAGAVCANTIGSIMAPITLLGLIFIIGILGFVPFFTGFVYLRNAIRAVDLANTYLRMPALVGAVVIGLLIAAGLPAIGEFAVSRIVTQSLNQILTQQDALSCEEAVQRIKFLGWTTDMDQLVRAYEIEPGLERKQRLASAYKSITDSDIDDRLAILND